MNSARKLEEKPIHLCLFHEKADCICIEPVLDQETLRSRLEHFIHLSNLQLKYKSNQLPAEILQEKIEQSILKLERL